jgi:hypothetical protein
VGVSRWVVPGNRLEPEKDETFKRVGSLLDADSFEDLPGKWQAAILKAEGNRPKLRFVCRTSSG